MGPSPPSPLETLSQEELERLQAQTLTEWRKRHPFQPQIPTRLQKRFLELTDREALYGGAAGGGKSSALLMAALQYAHIPGYAALLFRRTYADLAKPGALMDRAASWLAGTAAVWNEQKKTWRFPASFSGATLTFGHLEHENDKFDYQGTEVQFCGFDELTHFTSTQYRYMFSRLRRLKGSPVPLRMRASANPGGEGHEWVKQRFLVEGKAKGRVFVPARMEDNPYLDHAAYEESLAELDPVTREQLRHGDWEVLPTGPLFDRTWFNLIDALPLVKDASLWRWVRFWDLAATAPAPGKKPDWTVGALVGTHPELPGQYVVADVRRVQAKPHAVEQLVLSTAQRDKKRFGHVEIWMEQEPGSAGVKVIADYARLLVGFEFHGHRETGSKLTRARPVASAAEHGLVYLLRGDWLSVLLDELVAFPTKGVHDDQVDAISGAIGRLSEGTVHITGIKPGASEQAREDALRSQFHDMGLLTPEELEAQERARQAEAEAQAEARARALVDRASVYEQLQQALLRGPGGG